MEAKDWRQGVFMGASMRTYDSETKRVEPDPFAMRGYLGLNFGTYLRHWLSLSLRPGLQMPKIFHVNWFRKTSEGRLIWPGFAENCRILDWIMRRCDNEPCAKPNNLGYLVPTEGSLNVNGMPAPIPDWKSLFDMDKTFWTNELSSIRQFFEDQLPIDLPSPIMSELSNIMRHHEDGVKSSGSV